MGAIDPDGLAGEIYVGRGYGQVTNISSSIGTVSESIATTGSYSSEINIGISFSAGKTGSLQDVLKIGDERFKIISGSFL